MKTHEEIAERVLARRDTYKKEKKKRERVLLAALPATTLCLVLAVALTVMMTAPPTGTSPHNTDKNATDDSGRLLWADTRTYNSVSAMPTESAYVLPWEYRTDVERYFEFTYDGVEYSTRGAEIGASLLGDRLSTVLVTGYDDYAEEHLHTVLASVYAVTGIEREHLVAVRFPETDAYYLFRGKSAETAPEALGALLDRYALPDTLPLSDFRSYDAEGNEASTYTVTETVCAEIYAILADCADAPVVTDGYSYGAQGERVTFSISSEVLGITNRVFTIGADGVVKTNLADFGYAYDVGTETAARLLSLIRENAVPTETETAPRYYLTGTITAIGDGYIEVDDSIMMKNASDGIVFTVRLDDFRVRRFVDCGYLKVGSTVRVEYDGKIYADAPTLIEHALGIEKVIVSANGDVWIPE